MRLRFSAAAAVALIACPAFAHDGQHDMSAPPELRDAPMRYPGEPYEPAGARYDGYDSAAREAWLADCRQRLSSRENGAGGAVIGGVVGGVAGNRIAGRGNRSVGTVAGAAVGAVAGAAIDRAEGARRHRDECEAWLDDYYARYAQGGGYPGYESGYGYAYPQGYSFPFAYPAGCCMAPAMMAVPMMMVPQVQPKPNCTEIVEYVYEEVPVRPAARKRYIPRPAKIVPDKRVKILPDKRVK